LRLLGSFTDGVEIDEKWATGHRYLDMQEYWWEWRASGVPVVKQLA
jgi:hypothetical protein